MTTKQIFKYVLWLIVLLIIWAILSNLPFAKKAAPTKPESPVTSTSTTPEASIVPISIVTFKQDATSTPSISYEYPQFPSLSADFNDMVASSTLSRVAEFRADVAENDAARKATAQPGEAVIPMDSYSFISSWQQAEINNKYVSFIVRYDSYTGGANANQELQTFNYDVAARAPVSLQQLLNDKPDYLAFLSKTAREQLGQSLPAASPGYKPGQMLLDGTAPVLSNFQNFTFTDNAITIYFPKYQVAPGAFGEQKITIPRGLTN